MKVRYEEIVTPNTASETLPVIKFMNQSLTKGKKKSKSRTKKLKALTRSQSRRDCQACNEISIMNVKINPVKFQHDFDKLKYFVKLYQQYVLSGKVQLAEQCISRIKANHPIFFRLQ